MPTTSLMPVPKQRYYSDSALPLVGGRIYTYAAGTTNLKQTFTDLAGTVPQPNPIPLNARGEPASPVFWNGAYDIEVRDSLNNLIYSVQGYVSPNAYSDGLDATSRSNLAATDGGSKVGFLSRWPGAQASTLDKKSNQAVSVLDFMTPAQLVDLYSGTSILDHSSGFNLALAATGFIRCPHVTGGYNAKNLTLPAAFNVFGVYGDTPINNYYVRTNSTVIRTNGGDFMKGAAASLLFCARDIFIQGSGQTGMCFGTTSAVETGFCFENVGIAGFEKGFWAPQYSSSSFARDTSFTDCDYGLWSINVSNNSKLYNMGYNRCANACRVAGFGVSHIGSQISLGYTGVNSASFPFYIGYDLFIGLVNVTDVYTESYALDYSKNIIFNCRSSNFGDDHYKLDTFLSNGAGLRHLRVYSESLSQCIKSNLIEVNGSVPNNCPNIETAAGQTGLIRGVKVNGRTFNSVAGRTVFDTYDVEAVIAAGTALNSATVTNFGTTAVTLIGFPSTAIIGYADIINNTNTTAATGRMYFPAPDYYHCPIGSTGKTSGLFEVSAELAMDGLAAMKTYAVGVVFKVPGGGYAIKQVGEFRALARPGSALFDFSAEFKVNVRMVTASSVGVCFIPSGSVDIPAPADITGLLYGRIRVRFLEDLAP